MAENYREQQQEETEGIVDAGGFTNDPGTGMIAEDQETAGAADVQPQAPAPVPAANDEAAVAAAEASENVQVDLHENTGSGIDIAVVIIVLLVVIGCLGFGILNAPAEEQQQIIAQQQAAQPTEAADEAEADDSEPPYEVAELPEGVAVVINGVEVSEDDVSEYVARLRVYYGLEDDDAWAQWLVMYDYTPEKIRNMTLAAYVEGELVSEAIERYGIEVTQSDIDEIYNASRANFDSDEEWAATLKEAHHTEESFLRQCRQQAEQQALLDYLGNTDEGRAEQDAQILETVKEFYPEYADAQSLSDIPAEQVDPVREMLEYYLQQQLYANFLEEAEAAADIKMAAAPSDLPYQANLLFGYFNLIGSTFAPDSVE